MHLTTSKSGKKSTGAEIAKDFLGRGRDKNRITQTQKQISPCVVSPCVVCIKILNVLMLLFGYKERHRKKRL
jgi:hypothetical protein